MDLFGGMLSQILGGLGGGGGGGQLIGSILNQVIGSEGTNPFGDITGMLSGLVGGPGNGAGNILGDVAGLAKPVESLVSGGLGALNPFGSIIPTHYLPFLGLGAAGAAMDERQRERRI